MIYKALFILYYIYALVYTLSFFANERKEGKKLSLIGIAFLIFISFLTFL